MEHNYRLEKLEKIPTLTEPALPGFSSRIKRLEDRDKIKDKLYRELENCYVVDNGSITELQEQIPKWDEWREHFLVWRKQLIELAGEFNSHRDAVATGQARQEDRMHGIEGRLKAFIKSVELFAEDNIGMDHRIDELSTDLNAMAGYTGYDSFRGSREPLKSSPQTEYPLHEEPAPLPGPRALLIEANDVLRSSFEIATREGKETNWEVYRNRLKSVLGHQYDYLYPKTDVDNLPPST